MMQVTCSAFETQVDELAFSASYGLMVDKAHVKLIFCEDVRPDNTAFRNPYSIRSNYLGLYPSRCHYSDLLIP